MDPIGAERWREERRDRILQAAARVFARQAFHKASMDDIAQEAHVGKPTLYRYFPSKDALFAAVFVNALDELEARLTLVLDAETGLGEQLTTLIAEVVPMFRDHLVSLRLLDASAAAADISKRRIFRERRSRISAYLSEAVARAKGRGEIRELDPQRIGQLLIGMIWSATATSHGSAREIAREIVDLILKGVLTPASEHEGGWAPQSETDREPAHRLAGAAA